MSSPARASVAAPKDHHRQRLPSCPEDSAAVHQSGVHSRHRLYTESIRMQMLQARNVHTFVQPASLESRFGGYVPSSLRRMRDSSAFSQGDESTTAAQNAYRILRDSFRWRGDSDACQDSQWTDVSADGERHTLIGNDQTQLKRHFYQSTEGRKLYHMTTSIVELSEDEEPTPLVDTSTADSTTTLEDKCDDLLGALSAVYSIGIGRSAIPHWVLDSAEVPQAYYELFRLQGVPLTKENLASFVHDAPVAAMEKLCQLQLRADLERETEVDGQERGRMRFTTVRHPELVERVVSRLSTRALRRLPRYQNILCPWKMTMEDPEFPVISLPEGENAEMERKVTETDSDDSIMFSYGQFKEVQRDFFRRLEETAARRKSNRLRKRWQTGYRKVIQMLRISAKMADRSIAFERMFSTFVDLGDCSCEPVDYGSGRRIDVDYYRRKEEYPISHKAIDTLCSDPDDRTLVQLEDARRELQKVQVFSEFPIDVQERILRRAYYIAIGPKRIIVRQSHHPMYFYIIMCGQAYAKEHTLSDEKGHKAYACAFVNTGQTFGGRALILNKVRTASVISRTNMQLLAVHGEDYLDIFYRPSLLDATPPHLVYISRMDFMEDFPMELLKEKMYLCTLHHFRRNTVIAQNSKRCHNIFVIKSGYCKVFRKLDWRDRSEKGESRSRRRSRHRADQDDRLTSSPPNSASRREEHYVERESPYVTYQEMETPSGQVIRVPMTKLPQWTEKLHSIPLTVPPGDRLFLPLKLLREGEVFGLDQLPVCKHHSESRPTILVSLGAEAIALNKDIYCRHVSKAALEVVEKTFLYNHAFISRRLRERVSRDVHLEEVLRHVFIKSARDSAFGKGRIHEV